MRLAHHGGLHQGVAQYSPAVQRYLHAQREELLGDVGTDLWPAPLPELDRSSGPAAVHDDERELRTQRPASRLASAAGGPGAAPPGSTVVLATRCNPSSPPSSCAR